MATWLVLLSLIVPTPGRMASDPGSAALLPTHHPGSAVPLPAHHPGSAGSLGPMRYRGIEMLLARFADREVASTGSAIQNR